MRSASDKFQGEDPKSWKAHLSIMHVRSTWKVAKGHCRYFAAKGRFLVGGFSVFPTQIAPPASRRYQWIVLRPNAFYSRIGIFWNLWKSWWMILGKVKHGSFCGSYVTCRKTFGSMGWYIYLSLVHMYGTCKEMHHTWSLWTRNQKQHLFDSKRINLCDRAERTNGGLSYMSNNHSRNLDVKLNRFGRVIASRWQVLLLWCLLPS